MDRSSKIMDSNVDLVVKGERLRAHQKHSPHGDSMEMKKWDDVAWTDVIVEELGEASQVINDYRHGKHSELQCLDLLWVELLQTAAMITARMDAIDERMGEIRDGV